METVKGGRNKERRMKKLIKGEREMMRKNWQRKRNVRKRVLTVLQTKIATL